ncbi:MAG: hypothetical protein ACOYOP_02745 [Microthrixaceae bacterium]
MLWGSTLLTGALLLVTIGYGVTLGRVDVAGLRRDVVLPAAGTAPVPGELAFRVAEPLRSEGPSRMTVGVAVTEGGAGVRCRMTAADGSQVPVSGPGLASQLVRSSKRSYDVLVVADLRPGDYRASCTTAEGTGGSDRRFTVGRSLASSDVRDVVGPFLWFLLAAVPAAVLFIVGVVLLVIGLVRRSRSGGVAPG